MEILGIYLEKADKEIRKSLQEKTWYGFNSKINWHKIFLSNDIDSKIKECIKNQENMNSLYGYSGQQISISAIVGKNGTGKTTLINIYSQIINNFASYMKNLKFSNYNIDYEIQPAKGLKAELYYEINGLIYCISVNNEKITFQNNKYTDLISHINTLEELSEHTFYTISLNYSNYSDNPDWIDNLFHKNDGYFTPIVLVPYKNGGNIETRKEKELAEKRVFTVSLLLYKKSKEFIENYIPTEISFTLKDKKYYEKNNFYTDEYIKIDSYEKLIDNKIEKLKSYNSNLNIYNEEQNKPILIPDNEYDNLKCAIENYWNNYIDEHPEYLKFTWLNQWKKYLIYKTLKTCTNYEVISKELNFNDLENSLSLIIKNELWNENQINYINLKLITCKRFIEHSFTNIYLSKTNGSIQIDENFLTDNIVKMANSYDDVFINLLPEFFETHFSYSIKEEYKKKGKEAAKIELKKMSSGEQQLYNSLSYIIYHIKNAKSNMYGNKGTKIPYKYFNIIFDEAELYFHPEYQRCFIDNLIKIINKSNVEIPELGIIIITHSPFILSDIPANNILALGSDYNFRNTLGANIYDLLQNQFFMASHTGEITNKIIRQFSAIKKGKLSDKEKEFYKYLIEQLGDPYIKKYISQMYYEKIGLSLEQIQIEEYKLKIEELERKENEKNNISKSGRSKIS